MRRQSSSCTPPEYPPGAVITMNPLTLKDITLTLDVAKRRYLFYYFPTSLLLTDTVSRVIYNPLGNRPEPQKWERAANAIADK